MPDSPKSPPPAGSDPGPDVFKTIGEYRRSQTRVGCLGFTLSGWKLWLALAGVVLLIYLIRYPLS
jgi:hypothetical protein